MDRLLFALMLVGILHSVGASVRTGSLLCEPFLIIGIIASTRRTLVITLESSELMRGDKWSNPLRFGSNRLEKSRDRPVLI